MTASRFQSEILLGLKYKLKLCLWRAVLQNSILFHFSAALISWECFYNETGTAKPCTQFLLFTIYCKENALTEFRPQKYLFSLNADYQSNCNVEKSKSINKRNVFLIFSYMSVSLYVTEECHCHSEVECTKNWHCFLECGLNATCDDNHCHGDCIHHRK